MLHCANNSGHNELLKLLGSSQTACIIGRGVVSVRWK